MVSKKKEVFTEIQTLFHSESRHLLHNFGTQFPLGGAVFNFSQKIGLKSTKNVRFCILHKPMGGLELPPLATLLSSNALTKLRSENLWKLRTTIINRCMRLHLIICPKKIALLFAFSSIKLVLIRNKCYQCKLVCTGTVNEWCKILTIKTLMELNRT